MALVINAAQYGANPNDAFDDTAAINNALKAAHDAYMSNPSAGPVTVSLQAGTFIVSGTADKSEGAVSMLTGTTLQGAGMGQTVLKVADSWRGDITGVVRTPFNEVTTDVGLFDLTIDGNRDQVTLGKIDGFYTGVRPGSTEQDANIHVARVEIMDCSGYGFDPHEQTINLLIEDSVAHGNGLDGFVADYIVDSIYRGNIAYGNDRHGFNVTTTTTNFILENNEAYGNGSAGIVVQRGSENIPWPNNIDIIGGTYHDNVREGILLNLADDVTITGATIYGNLRQGVRIEGSTDTVVQNSQIFNNSQAGESAYDEISIRLRVDAVTGQTYYSTNTQILNNTIYSNGAINARYGIREEPTNDDAGATATFVSGNNISGMNSGTISLPGGTNPPKPPVEPSSDAQALVDDSYYLALYPDVKAAGVDPDDHYATFGWQEGRNPNAFFNTNAYLSANQDVDAANINPLDHYHQNGWKEGRDASVSFDTTLYLVNNADVRNAGIDPLEHFLAYGRFEGRQAYTAVGQAVQGTFDAEYYLLANPDVGLADVDAAFHFANHGWKEGRDPNAYFDTSAYLAAYADVAAAGVDPLEHYNTHGWKEGRDPSGAFDTSSYLATYADVAQANINPLAHYLKFGIYEGRQAFGDSIIG
ncbi:right-handed parallel beta-helix repeat-containing protein [Microvirga arabica]|uniref:right-handed parallel beta-helix repeat-containing protein n=2 Tax=Microvirga arabica TaxID=1128671 RepID=UPI0019398A73|nr:right-handed parallel beta-helix repeat-containing protein [Microvirga arabica]MBM1173039.1 right-handed parallel beta-helix repeat-containing protein [Microvirga arabica]